MATQSIIAVDVDNDGFDDIIVGNSGRVNQVRINNGNGTFTASIDPRFSLMNLPGGTFQTQSIAVISRTATPAVSMFYS